MLLINFYEVIVDLAFSLIHQLSRSRNLELIVIESNCYRNMILTNQHNVFFGLFPKGLYGRLYFLLQTFNSAKWISFTLEKHIQVILQLPFHQNFIKKYLMK